MGGSATASSATLTVSGYLLGFDPPGLPVMAAAAPGGTLSFAELHPEKAKEVRVPSAPRRSPYGFPGPSFDGNRCRKQGNREGGL